MRIYVGVTDNNWYKFLSKISPDEVNFWRPSDKNYFRAIDVGDMFLFKLHSPIDYIVGGGFFVRYSRLPVSLAWEIFAQKNGVEDYNDFLAAIYKYRKTNRLIEPDPVIGCIVLSSPFFFPESEWISVPEDWKSNIVQGKTYDTSSLIGKKLYEQVEERLIKMKLNEPMHYEEADRVEEYVNVNRYGAPTIVYPRIGQGTFKVLVTEAYNRRCAISGEKTLPALEAAHIKPYSKGGIHSVKNGLLLRRDLHTLFDRGYITIDENLYIVVSKRIKEDYGNGRDYYAFHGKKLSVIPNNANERPDPQFLRWHNENVFL
ncbi:HNH endonuclease [Caldicoprobacter faecalis]|uniref:Putative restriction endonuclease n=1 Tax=Caldicoprobacter faecalis TaxID=937334 RepID=A0A1I5X8M8_9FIRM|nr:putative restriction endonuclease [Caldicoprobacter faecalis]